MTSDGWLAHCDRWRTWSVCCVLGVPLSVRKDISDETARVMHEIANERDDMLSELKEKHRKKAKALDAESEDIVKASSSASKIAGLFNKRRK